MREIITNGLLLNVLLDHSRPTALITVQEEKRKATNSIRGL
jgi:hypothetical protein